MGALVAWSNDHDPCPLCDPFVALIFDSDDEALPTLPVHKHCRCYWKPTTEQVLPDNWNWQGIPDDNRHQWILYVAWMLRAGTTIPLWLQPLINEAQQWNEERERQQQEEEDRRRQEEEQRPPPYTIDDLLQESTMNQTINHPIAATTRIRLDTIGSNGQPRQFKGRLITAGRIRNALDEPGHLIIEAQAIRQAVEASAFDGLACFIDHPGLFDISSLRNLFGSWHSVAWNEETQSAEGILRYYPTTETQAIADRLQQILKDAQNGQPTPDIGVSLVFYPVLASSGEEGEPMTVTRFRKIESADLVFSPAADGRILQALSTIGGNPMTIQSPTPPANAQATSADTVPETTSSGQTAAGHPVPATTAAPPAPAHQNPPAQLSAQELEHLLQMVGHMAEQAVERRLAPLVEQNVVQLGGSPPRQRISGMRHASEDVNQAVGWIFGAPDAQTPEPRLRNSAELYRLLTGDIHWRGIFDPAEALATATVTTLSDLAVNAMNKVIIATWDTMASYRWYELVTVVQPNDGSLQDMAWISFGGIANLPVVAEGAAYTEATVADTKEADSFVKYGAYVGITRKMLRNSEIARIQAVPKALAVSAVRTREALIAGLFTSNSGAGPTLDDDSVALFHTASHANLLTTAFSYAAWSAARLECYKLTEAGSSKRLGFWPKFWLGPADLYDSALEIFGYGAGPGGKPGTGDNNVNPFGESRPGDPRPVPLAVPSFTDANDWAYLVDPNIQPIIQMSYSQNPGGSTHPMPELFSVVNETAGLMFSNDTMPIKVRDEFAYGVSTYRGIGKRNVT